MGLGQVNFAGLNMVEVAIARLKEFEPPEGYYLAFSGGKDSTVIYDLALKSGVKFDPHYSRTGIDPPELVQHIKKFYPEVHWEHPPSMWKAIEEHHSLPRRQGRFCCEELKEAFGSGRTIITGVRWAESSRRQSRRLYEVCRRDATKYYLHVIIDWSTRDVWDYIKGNNLPYCRLYDEGFKRLGCILCPMGSTKQAQIEMERWPKITEAWHRATLRLYDQRISAGSESFKRWPDGEAMWQWWLSRKASKDPAQCVMFQ